MKFNTNANFAKTCSLDMYFLTALFIIIFLFFNADRTNFCTRILLDFFPLRYVTDVPSASHSTSVCFLLILHGTSVVVHKYKTNFFIFNIRFLLVIGLQCCPSNNITTN